MTSIASNISDHERLNLIQAFKYLRPGGLVDLEFNSETPFRIKSRLVGFEEGKYIILSLSQVLLRDYSDLIQEGKGCIVRTLIEGEAGQCIAFRSTVDFVPVRPKGLLFIRFPKQIEAISLRKENRITTQLPATFVHRDENTPDALFDAKTEVTGLIKDISAGGCRIIAQWPENNNKIQHVPVYIKVVMTSGDAAILKAEIKNQQREDPANISLGMMFIPDNQLKKLLHQLSLD